LTLRSGNTKSMDYNAQASLQRRTPATRLKIRLPRQYQHSGRGGERQQPPGEHGIWLLALATALRHSGTGRIY